MVVLRHKIIAIYEYGVHTTDFQFGPKKAPKIIEFLQETNPQYADKATTRSFVYRAIKRQESAQETPHLDVFHDCRGENRASPKRKNPEIVTLVDELLSEPKTTAPKVKRALLRHGHEVSKQTIHRIAQDLCFRWTKPWYTDILTATQKLKHKIFCRELL